MRLLFKSSFILSLAVGTLLPETICPAATIPALPRLAAIREGDVVIFDSRENLLPGKRTGDWTLMAVTTNAAGKQVAVFEDFSTMEGSVALVDEAGEAQILAKSLEPTFADPARLYRGHSLAEVRASDHDLLGS